MRAPGRTLLVTVPAGVIRAAVLADRALCQLPPYWASRSWVLDRMFGPAESFEYVSRTTPLD